MTMQQKTHHDFILTNCDTDSISYCKKDMSVLSKEERKRLQDDLNSLFPDTIYFADDGYFDDFIVLKAKNYVMRSVNPKTGKVETVYKGSGLRNQNKEPALRDCMLEIIALMLDGKDNYVDVYNKYVKEALNIIDISRWSSKKTITKSVLHPKRTTEAKILAALQGTEYAEGDKRYFFFLPDGSLCLSSKFDGTYDVDVMLNKLFNVVAIFGGIIDVKTIFPNYSLKRNKAALLKLTNTPV